MEQSEEDLGLNRRCSGEAQRSVRPDAMVLSALAILPKPISATTALSNSSSSTADSTMASILLCLKYSLTWPQMPQLYSMLRLEQRPC